MRHLLLASTLFCCALSDESTAQTGLSEAAAEQHVYIDDDDQRSLADLRFDVESTNQHNLRITVSAMGPDVEPIAGFRGVSGGNRYTAEELGLILDGQHSAKVVTQFEDGKTTVGRLLQGEYGPLPERRLLPNGYIDFLGQTALHYPLELIVDPKTHSSGRRTTMIVINGQARLRCRYVLVDGQVEDLEVQSLGSDKFFAGRVPQASRRNGKFMLAVAQETKPPVSDEIWQERDIEGKWVLMAAAVAQQPETILAWVDFLVQKNEFQLLEWMAISIPDAFKSSGVGAALAKADAPQWVRVAAWHSNGPANFGHGIQQATSLLMNTKPGEAEHWLKTHKQAFDNWESSLFGIYVALQRDKFDSQNSSKYLPPLQPDDVFQLLKNTQPLADFGDRKTGEAGVAYRHQVVRAINAVPVSGRRGADLLKTLRDLTWNKDESIRIAALLAHSYLLPTSPATDAIKDFVTMADDTAEPEKIREAALMAYSYQRHPSVILKLHQVAADPQHGAWSSAVSRIGDIGRSWSVELLQQLADAKLSGSQQQLLADSLKRLTARVESSKTSWSWSGNASDTANGIVLAVFASKVGDPNAERIHDWVVAGASRMDAKQFEVLKARFDFSQLPPIWLPCAEEEFVKSYESIRQSLKRSN